MGTCIRDRRFIQTLVYDHPSTWDLDQIVAIGPNGSEYPVQVLETLDDVKRKRERGEYTRNNLPDPSRLMHDSDFGPQFARLAFSIPDLPSYGYKVFRLKSKGNAAKHSAGVAVERGKDAVTLENQRYRVRADARRGGISSLYDKQLDYELVPENELLGALSVEYEAPAKMSAWKRQQIVREDRLTDGWELDILEEGPVVGVVEWTREYRDSTLSVELRLPDGSDELELSIDAEWREAGSEDQGVPALRTHVPLRASTPQFRYDVPYGTADHSNDGKEVPANRWADVADSETGHGIAVFNDTTHGYSMTGNTLSLTLLRSTYSPDPVPEMGSRSIECRLRPHSPDWDRIDADRFGQKRANPPVVEQLLPETELANQVTEYLSTDTPQVAINAVKQAYDGDDLIVRLYERAGSCCTTTLRSEFPIDHARETTVLEEDTDKSYPVDSGTVSLELGPNEIRTLRLGINQ